MKNTLRLAALLLACMLAGAIGPSIRDAAYSTWDSAPFVQQHRFNHRVDVALANPFACGNGSCGLQGVNTALTTADTGGGLCTDSTGTLVNLCTTIAEALSLSATTPALTFTSAATQPQISSLNATNFEMDSVGASGFVFKNTVGGGCTGANVCYNFFGGASDTSEITFTGNGGINALVGNITASVGNIIDTAAGFKANAVGAGVGYYTAAGAPIDANMTGGQFVVGTGGMFEDGHTCSVSMTNASPSLSSSPATDFACAITAASGSATATQYQITFPTEAGTRVNAPLCFVQEVAGASILGNTCSVSILAAAPVATINFSVAPNTSGRFNIWLVANGP